MFKTSCLEETYHLSINCLNILQYYLEKWGLPTRLTLCTFQGYKERKKREKKKDKEKWSECWHKAKLCVNYWVVQCMLFWTVIGKSSIGTWDDIDEEEALLINGNRRFCIYEI